MTIRHEGRYVTCPVCRTPGSEESVASHELGLTENDLVAALQELDTMTADMDVLRHQLAEALRRANEAEVRAFAMEQALHLLELNSAPAQDPRRT